MSLDRSDLDGPRIVLAILVVLTVGGLVAAATTSSVAFGTYNPSWEGASDLRQAADAERTEAETVRNVSAYETAGNGTLAFVLSPGEPYTATEAERLREFVGRGGTLVVAEDFGSHSNPLLRDLGVETRVNGSLLRDERYNFRSPALPVATGVGVAELNTSDSTGNESVGTENNATLDGNQSVEPPSALTEDIHNLTLNYGTVLEPGNATVLVRSSAFAYLDTNRNATLDENESVAAYPVVSTERIGAGRVVVVSDPSLFINAMLERPGNRQLVANLMAGNERVFIDVSHANGVPPLTAFLLTVRDSPLMQGVLGLLALLLVGSIGWYPGVWIRVRTRFVEERTEPPVAIEQDDIIAYLQARHPDWDTDRIARVSEGVIHQRREEWSDE